MALLALLVQLLLLDPADVWCVAVDGDSGLPGRIVLALVQAQMLGMVHARRRALDHDRRHGGGE
jgi:hypothetical protein